MNSSAAPVSAITFDLDGTLYDAPSFRRAYLWRAGWGIFRAGKIRRLKERFRGEVFADGAALEETLGQELGFLLHTEPHLALQIERHYFETLVIEVLEKLGPRAEARAAVEAAVGAGAQVAVVSDYAPEAKLRALGLDDLPWAALVGADRLGALKPYPRAFEAAVSTLGVAAANVVHIGDRADTDVRGAQAAGCRGLLVEPGASLLEAVQSVLPVLSNA